ncbi:MAG: hypothetical protein AB2531_05305 [Candidatus Thiodiazotropha sp.]
MPYDLRILADCGLDIPKGLDGVPLAAKVLTDPVKTLYALFGSVCLGGL